MAGLTRRFAIAALSLAGALAVQAVPGTPASAETAGWTEWDPANELGWPEGDAGAPVTVIEYFSPTCSHCKDFAEAVLPLIETDYVATGKVRFIAREYIRNSVDTTIISQARCLNKDDGRAFLHDVFAHQEDVFAAANGGTIAKTLVEIGTPYGIADRAKFDACYKDMNTRFDMLAVEESADHYKVEATPTFIVNGEVHKATIGMLTPEGFAAFLDAELARTAPETN
jgi:protein-disulfide isomerase